MARQRRKTHRKIIAVAEAHAYRPVRLRAVRCARRPCASAARFFILPHAVAAPARHVDVVRAAVIARELADDVVLIRMPRRAENVLPPRIEFGELSLRCIDLPREVFALRRVAQRFREQEIFVAAAVELRLAAVDGALHRPDFVFDARQRIARLSVLLALLHETLLELEADRILLRPVTGRRCRSRSRARRRSRRTGLWRRHRRRGILRHGGGDGVGLAINWFARHRRALGTFVVTTAERPPALRRSRARSGDRHERQRHERQHQAPAENSDGSRLAHASLSNLSESNLRTADRA